MDNLSLRVGFSSEPSLPSERLNNTHNIVRVGDHDEELFDIGEPISPREILQHKIEMAVRDAHLAMGELVKLRTDPASHEFFNSVEGDLWSIKTRVEDRKSVV